MKLKIISGKVRQQDFNKTINEEKKELILFFFFNFLFYLLKYNCNKMRKRLLNNFIVNSLA